MKKHFAIALAGAAVLVLAHAQTASGQSRDLQRRLAAATRLTCTFSTLATGNWDNTTAAPSIAVTPAEVEVRFFNINIDEGTADTDSGFGAAFISVRYSQGYLHLLQMSDAGPLYITTVLAQAAPNNRFKATQARFEYSPTVIPGFTSRPELYVGTCAATAEPAG